MATQTRQEEQKPPAQMAPPAPGSPLTHAQILLVMSGLMLGMLLASLDQTIVSTALPTIVGELSGLNHLSWVITAYLLTSTVTVPLYGKLSDMYGRKQLFQFAIVIFLIGSVLSGLAQSMTQLIVFRGVQGLGAGGLLSLAFAIIGDIIPPRDRGKYTGYTWLVFGSSSVIGPLLGGFFTESLSWRWIFFVNLPLGAIALVVTTRVLQLPVRHLKQRIDLLGAALIIASASSILLATTWGGSQYAWSSVEIVALLVAGFGMGAAFVLWELKVSEPLLPLRLFRLRMFSVMSAIGAVVGMAMFGVLAFLPLYLQIVKGATPTESGLRMLPLMVGLMATSIGSGLLISKTGRYRFYPMIGTGLMCVSLFLLSNLSADTSWPELWLYIILMGAGLGCVMQIVTLAVQNAVPYSDMGTATGAVNFFRSMGSALGVAIFGAILSNRLNAYIPKYVGDQASGIVGGRLQSTPEQIRSLPEGVHHGVIEAFSHSLDDVFFWALPVAVAAFLLSFLIKEIPLRRQVGEAPPEGAQTMAEPI